MKKVITYGTFDLFHYGHMKLLQRAKNLGSYLIVALSTDEFNAGNNKTSVMNYKERKEIIDAIKYVDEVIPETEWGQKMKDVVDNKVDILVMGDDWKGKFDFLREYCEVVYLPRTANVSSTMLKQAMK